MGRYSMRKCKWCESINLTQEPKYFKDGSAHIALICVDCGKHNQYINENKERKAGNSRVKVAYTRQTLIEELGFDTFEQFEDSTLWQQIENKVLQKKNRCRFCEYKAHTMIYMVYTRDNIKGKSLYGIHPICKYCNERLIYTDDGHKRSEENIMRVIVKALKKGIHRIAD